MENRATLVGILNNGGKPNSVSWQDLQRYIEENCYSKEEINSILEEIGLTLDSTFTKENKSEE